MRWTWLLVLDKLGLSKQRLVFEFFRRSSSLKNTYLIISCAVTIAKLGWLSNVVGMYFVNVIFLPIGHRALSPVGWQGLQIELPTRKKNATQTSLRNTLAVSQ
jgi:hypothetical protein